MWIKVISGRFRIYIMECRLGEIHTEDIGVYFLYIRSESWV